MKPNQIYAYKAVKRINDRIYQKYDDAYSTIPNGANYCDLAPDVSFQVFGYDEYSISIILHTGVTIELYNSYKDSLLFNEDLYKYESLYKLLKHKINGIKDLLNTIPKL